MIRSLTVDDIAWAERRAAEWVAAGLPLVDALELAARECSARMLAREAAKVAAAFDALDRRAVASETRRDEQRERHKRQRESADAEERAKLTLRGAPAQQPTLRASLGDLIAAKGRR